MFDGRIPLRFADAAIAGPGEALLIEGDALAPEGAVAVRYVGSEARHAARCACCAGRAPAVLALARLFQARVRGEVAWFSGVVAVAADPAALRATLAGDLFTAARFRVQG